MITPYNLYEQPVKVLFAFTILIIWSLFWKGLALWYAAQEKKKGWFIALLLLNTFGFLPIIYLIWFRGKTESEAEEVEPAETTAEEKPKRSRRKKPKKKEEESAVQG